MFQTDLNVNKGGKKQVVLRDLDIEDLERFPEVARFKIALNLCMKVKQKAEIVFQNILSTFVKGFSNQTTSFWPISLHKHLDLVMLFFDLIL